MHYYLFSYQLKVSQFNLMKTVIGVVVDLTQMSFHSKLITFPNRILHVDNWRNPGTTSEKSFSLKPSTTFVMFCYWNCELLRSGKDKDHRI